MNNDELVLIKYNQNEIFKNLFQPLKNCVRIKYTCVAINSKYLICGASSGGLYIFKRLENDLKFILTIPGNIGKVTTIVFSENNTDLFAFGTNRGIFKLILLSFNSEINIIEISNNQQYEEIYSAKSFTKFSITLIKFQEDDLNEFKLFIADTGYNVYLVNKLKTFSSILFKNEIPIKILKLDSTIHQIEIDEYNLLVSTDEKALILNMNDLSLNQLGTKTHLNGIYGSCYFEENDGKKFIFSSRPNLRLWKVNLNGNVICTHQFKNYFKENISNFIYSLKDNNYKDELNDITIQSNTVLNLKDKNQNSYFNLLHSFKLNGFNYLVTYTNVPESILFIINPISAQIIFWTKLDNEIKNVLFTNEEIIILHDFEVKTQQINSNIQNLFLIIKLYDLNFFKENPYYLKKFSKLSLFKFIKNNRTLVNEILEQDINFQNFLKDEWSNFEEKNNKLDSNFLEIGITNDEINELKNNLSLFTFKNSLDKNFGFCLKNDSFDGNSYEILDQNLKKNFEVEKIINQNEIISSNDKYEKIENINEKSNENLSDLNDLKKLNSLNENNFEQINKPPKILSENILKLTSKNRWNNETERSLKLRLEILINEEKKNLLKKKCLCGYPFPRSHLLLNDNQNEIKKILIKLLNEDNLNNIKLICFENAIWDLYLDLLVVNNQFEDYLLNCLLLMDINLFYNNDTFIQIFKKNTQLNQKFFEFFLKQKNLILSNKNINGTVCLICEKSYQLDYLKWNEMLNFLYKVLEIEKLVDLLLKYNTNLPNTILSSKFCLNLLQSETIKQYESSLTNEKLLKLNDHFKLKKFNIKKNLDSKLNWSIYLNLKNKNCDICDKSLKDYKKPLLVFKCHHVYHKKCDEKDKNIKYANKCFICVTNKIYLK